MKYDGYRLRLERDGDRVQLITRGGYDWAKRYPWIVEAVVSLAAARMRRHRKRRREGLRCLTILLRETEIDVLIRRALLKPEMRNNEYANINALLDHFD